MEPLFSHRSRGFVSRASLNNSGAMNSTRNNSEEMLTSWTAGTTRATTAPTAICTSGSDSRDTIWHSTADPITQANTMSANSKTATRASFPSPMRAMRCPPACSRFPY